MSGEVEQLSNILASVPVAVTLDIEASVTSPCFHCGTLGTPRRLFVVGVWTTDRVSLRGVKGSPIRRPLCSACSGEEEEDVRPVPPAWAELHDLVEGARSRGFEERFIDYLRSVMGLVWAKAFRAGERASGRAR
jgi:hypothetical protein